MPKDSRHARVSEGAEHGRDLPEVPLVIRVLILRGVQSSSDRKTSILVHSIGHESSDPAFARSSTPGSLLPTSFSLR